MYRNWLRIIFCLSITLSFSLPVHAQEVSALESIADFFSAILDKNEGSTIFRSLYIPSGGRAEAMGGAYTALASDIGFFDYNPAASAQLQYTEFAVFHNSWIADSALETIAYTQRLSNFGFGAAIKCFYVPFTEYNIFGERVHTGYYSETTAILNASYNFFAGYKFKGLCLGGNIKGALRTMPDYTDDKTNEVIKGSGLSQSAFGLMGDVGILLRFNLLKFYSARNPNFNIGVAAHNIGAAITGFGKQTTFDDPLPSYISCGISWQFFRPITLAIEFQQPFNMFDIKKSEQWAAGLGTSIQFADFFAFQCGFLLRGANPRFSLGGELSISEFVFNINYALDLGTSFTPVNRITLTAKINLGDGGREELQNKIDSLYSAGLHFYAEGKLQEAIDIWSEILLINPRFDPAISGIKSAKNTLELAERIKNLQTLD